MGASSRLVIFDCDGTLLDSQHIIHAAMTHAYESQGLLAPSRKEVLRVVGLSLVQAISTISPQFEHGLCETLAENYKQSFSSLRSDERMAEPMFDGAAQVLANLHGDKDIILGLATGKSRKGVDRFIKREQLHGVFDTIQTADDALSKPHPMMVEQALAETGMDKGSTVMVGDTTFDMEMAVNGGITAIGVAWGYHSVDELYQAGASVVISHFSELHEIMPVKM